MGGNRLEYDFDTGSPAASMLDTKILSNSTISDASKGTRFLDADIEDFFLILHMDEPEYMRISFKYSPKDIIRRYDLTSKVATDSFVYTKIKRGMYGLQ